MNNMILDRLKITRVATLIGIMICIIVLFGISLSYIHYRFNISEHEQTLNNLLISREQLINSMLAFEKKRSGKNFNYNTVRSNIINLLDETKARNPGMGISGEIVLAEKEGNSVVFINRHRFTQNTPKRVSFNSNIAIPMQLALERKNGFVLAKDYRGVKVLAAYRYVESIHVGIVVKQDYNEIVRQYLTSLVYAGIIGGILIIIGAIFFLKIGDRFTIEIASTLNKMEIVFNTSLDGKWLVDSDFNIIDVNDTFLEMFSLTRENVIGKKCYEILHSNFCHTEKCRCLKLKNFSKEKLLEENRSVTACNGKHLTVQSFAAAIKDEKDNFSRMFESFIDISERVNYENSIKKESKLQQELNKLSINIQNNLKLRPLSDIIITYLCNKLDAQVGNIYIKSKRDNDTFKLFATFAGDLENIVKKLEPGQTMLGQAIKEKRMIILDSIPDNYINISSSLGKTKPKNLLIQPFLYNGEVNCVCEIASISSFDVEKIEILNRSYEIIASTVNTAINNSEIKSLLIQSQKQSEELQANNEELEAQQEELKTANDKLEKQTEKLKKSEEDLLSSKVILEETNKKLLEKNEFIENSKIELQTKAKELEAASRYKSEFLANMSHELRTPLNSLLILANRLSRNKEENLTEEQRQDADIIYRQGNELLKMINNILNLSKIEAGKEVMNIENVKINELMNNIKQTFDHIISGKGLEFKIDIQNGTPNEISTDKQKLEQIIKNLISNAVKFTNKGRIAVEIFKPDENYVIPDQKTDLKDKIIFKVSDTGIGIDKDKCSEIFEAFRQVDSSITRGYEGTGLGLTISKKFAQLLGGDILLESEFGIGSTFLLYIEENFNEQKADEVKKIEIKSEDVLGKDKSLNIKNKTVSSADFNSILIFASDKFIVKKLAGMCSKMGYKFIHESNFKMWMEILSQHIPAAIIIDLDDFTENRQGTKFLQKIKENNKFSHIPVFVLSSFNKSIQILKLGAISYTHKPVSEEGLKSLFNLICDTIENKKKKLLIVDDDENVIYMLKDLLSAQNLDIESTESGKDAVDKINKDRYDCVIMELKSNDINGFDILKKIEDSANCPPIIINTDKNLTQEENLLLNKYTDSIIIKSSHSKGRLVEETSSLLHMRASDYRKRRKYICDNVLLVGELLKDKNVLIVDDDMRNLYALETELKSLNINTYKATDGKNCIDILRKNKNIDIIIMDIMMPIMDGYEAIKIIRADNNLKNIPIIALTARAMKEERAECLVVGADDYISKPVDINKLLSTVKLLIGKNNE